MFVSDCLSTQLDKQEFTPENLYKYMYLSFKLELKPFLKLLCYTFKFHVSIRAPHLDVWEHCNSQECSSELYCMCKTKQLGI